VSIDPAQIHIPAPTSTTTGSLDAQVKVSGLAQAPEPTTLFLGGLALPLLGVACRRRRLATPRG
jgi:PEP-CTERM motif